MFFKKSGLRKTGTECVMLIRWALRVNDIVQRLDKIVEILNAK